MTEGLSRELMKQDWKFMPTHLEMRCELVSNNLHRLIDRNYIFLWAFLELGSNFRSQFQLIASICTRVSFCPGCHCTFAIWCDCPLVWRECLCHSILHQVWKENWTFTLTCWRSMQHLLIALRQHWIGGELSRLPNQPAIGGILEPLVSLWLFKIIRSLSNLP